MIFSVEKKITLPDPIMDIRYHPTNPDIVAASTISGNIQLFDSLEARRIIKRHHKGSSIRKVRFTRDGYMVTISKSVKVHDLETDQTIHVLKKENKCRSPLYSLKPLGSYMVAAGDDDGKLMIWDIRSRIHEPLFTAKDCEQYISDIDGLEDGHRMIVCSSGEGTLTVYDMRNKGVLESQSELFDAGFQCLKIVDLTKKIVIGAEDCGLYVFNQNEWSHTSTKFSILNDTGHQGKSSIDCMDIIDGTTILAGCSDGYIRAASLYPHRLLAEVSFCNNASLEAIHSHPDEQKFIVCGENYINYVNYDHEQCDDEDDDDDDDGKDENTTTSEAKRFKRSDKDEDYLGLFRN